jgi:hypothetical protein
MSEDSTFDSFVQQHKMKIGIGVIVTLLLVLILYVSGTFSSQTVSASTPPTTSATPPTLPPPSTSSVSISNLTMTSQMASEFPPNGLMGRYVVIGRVRYIYGSYEGSFPNNINIREIEIYNSNGVKYKPTNAFSTSVLNDDTASYGPQIMIDGNLDLYNPKRTATKPQTKNQYVLVDLGANQNIAKIIVRNYATEVATSNYILGCQVQVFNNNFEFVWASNVIDKGDSVYNYPALVNLNPYKNIFVNITRTPSNFPINGLTGQFVVVARPEGTWVIQLREIEIYNSNGAKYVNSTNSTNSNSVSTSTISIPMTAYSSSVLDDAIESNGPQRLIDGSMGMWDAVSTKFNEPKSYMLVDLGANRNIGKIIIHNYAIDGSIADYIRGCQVQVFDNNFGFVWASNVITAGRGEFTYMYTPATGSTGGTGVV